MLRQPKSRTIVPIFEIIGSHMVDVFYNKLYRKAVEDTRKGQHESITDGYRFIIGVYISSIADLSSPHCDEEIIAMHTFYQSQHRGGVSIQFAEFEDQFLSHIIPQDYFRSFTSIDKDKVFREVIIKVILEFSREILRPKMLSRVVDNHTEQSNVVDLQNTAYGLLILRREEYYAQFAQETIREKLPPGSTTNVDVFNRLKKEYSQEVKRRVDSEKELRKAKRVIEELSKTARAQQKKLMELEVRLASNISTAESGSRNVGGNTNTPIAYAPTRGRTKTPAPPRFSSRDSFVPDDEPDDDFVLAQQASSSSSSESAGLFGDDDFDRDAGFGV